MIELIDYTDQFAPDFERINLEWLDKYHLTEEQSLKTADVKMELVM